MKKKLSKITVMIAALLLACALLPAVPQKTYAASVVSVSMKECLHGVNWDDSNNCFVTAGSVCWFNIDTVCEANDALMEAFLNHGTPSVYARWEAESAAGKPGTKLDTSGADVYWYVPQGAIGEDYQIIFDFGSDIVYASERFTVTANKAFIDTIAKTITLQISPPLPGNVYADASLSPGTALVDPFGYTSKCSVVNIPVGSGDEYVALYQRWSEYMMPEKYTVSVFNDNWQYHFRFAADFSHAPSIKDQYKNYKIKTQYITWELPEYAFGTADVLEFSANFTNGTDPHAAVDLGSTVVNLSNGSVKYHDSVAAEADAAWGITSTLFWSGVNNRYVSATHYNYFDLDGDGNEDLYRTYDDDYNEIFGVCSTHNLTGLYTIKLSQDVIKKAKAGQGDCFFETITFVFSKTSIAKATVKGITAKTYTGKAITQNPTVRLSGFTLRAGTDYSVAYSNNKKVGTATVTITGKDSFTGTIMKTFAINPKGTKLSKLTPDKNAVKVKWKKQTKQTTGYQIQYALNKKFTSDKKMVTVKGRKKTTTTLNNLKAKKQYYVRIRTYKKVKGKKYYSSWSKAKTVKTK